MTDTQTWRKRNACERCRKQKVRCEYDSVSVRRCVRCIRTNSECVVPERNGKRSDASPEEVPPSMAPLTHDVNAGALKAVIRDGFYDIHECATFYEMFTASGQQIPACEYPPTLCELAAQFPQTALALVTVVALSTSTKRSAERLDLVKPLMISAADPSGAISFDTQSAFLLLTEYMLPFFEKGIMRLSLAHGAMCALQQRHGFFCPKSEDYGPIPTSKAATSSIARLYEFTANSLMSVSFMRYFTPVNDIAKLYTDLDKLTHPVHSLYMSQIYQIYNDAFTAIQQSLSVSEVWEICVRANGQIESLPDPVPKYVPCGYIAQAVLVSVAMSWSVSMLHCECLAPYLGVITSAIELIQQFASIFNAINVTVFPMPIWWAYMACHSLTVVWSIRLYAFSVGLDIDVPLDEVKAIIGDKWREMLATSFTGRRNYIAWLMAQDATRLQFGYYDETVKRVVGAGSMDTFFVYRRHETSCPTVSSPITRRQLWEMCQQDTYAHEDSEFEPETPAQLLSIVARHIRNTAPGLRY